MATRKQVEKSIDKVLDAVYTIDDSLRLDAKLSKNIYKSFIKAEELIIKARDQYYDLLTKGK